MLQEDANSFFFLIKNLLDPKNALRNPIDLSDLQYTVTICYDTKISFFPIEVHIHKSKNIWLTLDINNQSILKRTL